jgi:hypothetical protein
MEATVAVALGSPMLVRSAAVADPNSTPMSDAYPRIDVEPSGLQWSAIMFAQQTYTENMNSGDKNGWTTGSPSTSSEHLAVITPVGVESSRPVG